MKDQRINQRERADVWNLKESQYPERAGYRDDDQENKASNRPRLEDTYDVNSDENNDANEHYATEPRNVNPTRSPAQNYRFMVRNSHTEEDE